jgi:hypothetical protein
MNETGKVELDRVELLHITDGCGNLSCGCDQDWYRMPWQRMAGCGPSVAANLFYYLHRTGRIDLPFPTGGRDELVALMEAVWKFVTPKAQGLHTTKRFVDGAAGFAKTYGLPIGCRVLDVPKRREDRQDARTVADFIAEGLRAGSPVAFLNLSNGGIPELDTWHWVTIVAIDRGPDGSRAVATVYDSDRNFEADLAAWLVKTAREGGFVHFTVNEGTLP